ncbi:MAG: radical SAM-associated putative lipoprotein [Muribaculaceae bacterium]|nr:radical SAM-associated putative lipoprotein [Muribaculaceae bacterium]
MKLFSRRLSLSTICSSFLTLLGFSSCSESAVMYGMPTGDFVVRGAVTDENGNEVRNAEIRVTHPEVPSGIFCLGESTTDSKGNYEIKGNEFLTEIKVVCIPETSDLKPDSVNVKMKYKDADKHDSWDYGHADATVNFTLKSAH